MSRFASTLLLFSCVLASAAAWSQAPVASLRDRRVFVESISGDGSDSGRCIPNTEGWSQIIGFVDLGDGARHIVEGKCLSDGTVLVLQDLSAS